MKTELEELQRDVSTKQLQARRCHIAKDSELVGFCLAHSQKAASIPSRFA